MSSACQKALGLLEIIRVILSHIDTGQALARCVSVNKQWHEEAIRLLWHGSVQDDRCQSGPTAYDLCELVRTNAPRFIGYMQFLELGLNHPTHASLQSYSALFKRHIWGDASYELLLVDLGSDNMDETRMATLLHPGLLVLELFGGANAQT